MYTDAMARAFRSIRPPKNFSVTILDQDEYLNVRASEVEFLLLPDDEKRHAIEYMVRVKKALEDCGAIVQLVREADADKYDLGGSNAN